MEIMLSFYFLKKKILFKRLNRRERNLKIYLGFHLIMQGECVV